MTNIDLEVLSTVTGGASTVGADMVRSVEIFGNRLNRSSARQVHNFSACEYKQSNDLASGDPARVESAQATNCFNKLAPLGGTTRRR